MNVLSDPFAVIVFHVYISLPVVILNPDHDDISQECLQTSANYLVKQCEYSYEMSLFDDSYEYAAI